MYYNLLRIFLLWSAVKSVCAANIDCEKFTGINKTFSLSYTKSTPPTNRTIEVFYNPCDPVGIEGCADDDHLCEKEYIEIDGKSILSAIRPFGSAAHGAETWVFMDFGSLNVQYEGARWGDDNIFEQIEILCGDKTEFARLVDDNHHFRMERLQLTTPSVCGSVPDPVDFMIPHRGWSKMQVLALVLLVGILALFGGILFLWLFLKFAQGRGDLSADVGLFDALHDVISGLAFNIRKLLRWSR